MSDTTSTLISKIKEDIGEYNPFVVFVDTVVFYMNRDDCFDIKNFSLNINKNVYAKCDSVTIPLEELYGIIKASVNNSMIIYIVKDLNNLFIKYNGYDRDKMAYIYLHKSEQTIKYIRKSKLDNIFLKD